ncbi:MAG: XdhC family protein [Streptosporangiales bacterium]
MTASEAAVTAPAEAAEVAARIRAWRAAGASAVFARVIDLAGFSTWSADELVAVRETGEQAGDILGRYGAEQLKAAAVVAEPPALRRLMLEVHGDRIAEAGLSCGGQAELLVQPADTVPDELWAALADRVPVALLTRLDGPAAGSGGVAVTQDGAWFGNAAPSQHLLDAAVGALVRGRTNVERIDDPDGAVLLEAWVPAVRVVVVGSGELATAIAGQGELLGWQTRATEDPSELDTDLAWAGASAALVVLSHGPRLDVDAIAAGLSGRVGYIGAMGSRRTQSRREVDLRAMEIDEAAIERVHRPIGLDLGGRTAPEVALSICAEILAAGRGRDGRPLAERRGAITDRPAKH